MPTPTRVAAAVLALALAAPAPAAPASTGGAPAPGTPLPAGALRADEVVLPFALRLVGKGDARAAEALVRKLAARHLPGVKVLALGGERPAPPALGLAPTEGEPVPAEALRYFGRGLDETQAARLGNPHPMVGLLLVTRGGRAGAELKRLTALLAEAAKALGAVVDDAEARLYFGPAAFAESVARGGFDGELPVVSRHVQIHSYRQDDGTIRSVTVGMSKLGLPDLVVNGHAQRSGSSIGSLVNAAAQLLHERGALERAGRLEVGLRAVRARAVREQLLAAMLPNGKGTVEVGLAVARREDGDAENRLAELVFDGEGAPTERQQAAVERLFGSEDPLFKVKHDEALLAESARARARLLAMKARLSGPRDPGEHLLVKAPFETSSGGNEWMWVEVTSWKGTRLHGLLANDPYEVPGLRAGAVVDVDERDVFDYLLHRADGTEEGNTTSALIQAAGR